VRISELARRTGVPVGTVKYYLREGLLPAGERTSATQAQYGEEHVARLGLIRVLVGIGGLSIATTRDVLAAIDDPPESIHHLVGAAHAALSPVTGGAGADRTRARELVARRGWAVYEDAPALGQLAAALDGLEAAGVPGLDALVERYADVAAELGRADVAAVPVDSPAAAVRFVVTATVLFEPLLLALRRLAQEDASARRFEPDATGPRGS
jgi:DNA-binding transcriptional MerR regulator